MKPNFALTLSHEGIALLHQSAAGWVPVGNADPASATLSEDLQDMRRRAAALAPGGIRCKLVIPDEQIRYLSIETPGFDLAARWDAARTALEGATPYAVEELALDVFADDEMTHVAAVALETLEEAEAFASMHDFQPVCFVAQPSPDHPFASEPNFGPTAQAATLQDDDAARAQATAVQSLSALPEPQDLSALDIDALTAESTEMPAPETEPSFVSRRRVPTFQTDALPAIEDSGATAGSVPGFGEPSAAFEAAPARPPEAISVVPAPAPVVRRTNSDAERFTIYGARSDSETVSGRMGLTAVAIVAAVVVAIGGASFIASAANQGGIAFFDRLVNPKPVVQFNAPEQPQTAVTVVPDTPEVAAPENEVELASLEPTLSDEDVAVLDALRAPVSEPPAPTSEQDRRATYAVTGIWPVAPEVPSPPALVDLADLYVTSIDPVNQNFDAVALPSLKTQEHDLNFLTPASPAPAGTKFALDDRGLVVPTPQGSMNPDGIMVFAGPPLVRQPNNMVKTDDPGVDLKERLRLAGFRPKLRPGDLIESSERANFSGLTKSELSEIRPRLRPQSAQESAQESALASASLVETDNANGRSLLQDPDSSSFDSATARAIVASLRPGARPSGFDKTVANARESTPAPQPVARVAPRTVTPKIPSSASATREATVKNALNLRKVNLIGVYGSPSSRRALVRLSNGRYKKVQVGDRIDGGRISAIGDSELRYQKSGRAIVLKMPRG